MRNSWKQITRRTVSLLLSLVLALTLVTPAAFATEVVDGSGTAIIEGNANPADANPNEDTEGKGDVDKNAEDEQQPAEPDDENAEPSEGEDAVNEPSNEADTQEGEGTDTPVVAQRTVTVERYRTDAAYEVKIVVGVEEDGTTEKLDTTYAIGSDTKTVKLRLTTADYAGEPVYIKTALDDVLVTEGKNKTPALTKDTPTLEYTLPNEGDVTLYYGTQEDFVSAWYTSVTDDKYTIRTAEELAYFAQLVNGGDAFFEKTVTLARDIDLSAVCHPADEESGIAEASWTPIGNYWEDASFCGVFDGNGKEIVNLYISSDEVLFIALFDNVVAGGMVKNLMVDGSIAAKNAVSVGGIAAFLYGGSITNCENRVTINLTTESKANNFHAGGIVGYVYGDKGGDEGIGSSTVDSCSNSGSIDVVATVSGCIGGIAGALGDADPDVAPDYSEGTIRLCQNSGEIRVTECKNNTWVGGIIGIGTGGSLTNCYNSGAVICTADKNDGMSFVGGVIGSSGDYTNEGDDASDYAISISACENGGAVCATDTNAGYSSAWAGGIAGFSYGAISNAANTGRVQGQGMAGGIVSFNMPAAVSNCYNWGDVIDNDSDSIVSGIGFVTDDGEDGSLASNSYYICKINSDDTVDMKYINKAEQDITYEEAAHTYKVGEDTLVKTLNENRGSDGLKWFVNIPEGITKPIFVKVWDGTNHPHYVPDGTEKDIYITYDPNGGSSGKTVAVTVKLNEDGTVKTPGSHTILTAETAGVKKDFCELKDWRTSVDSEGATYTIGQVISVSEDLILYAQWRPLWEGSGTEGDPYQIENEADWLKMQKYAEKYSNYPDMWFALMDDIALGNSYEPFTFAGNLKGNRHTVSVDVPKSTENDKHSRGLFSNIIGGDIGIRIENLTVAGSVTAYQYDYFLLGTL